MSFHTTPSPDDKEQKNDQTGIPVYGRITWRKEVMAWGLYVLS
jgi:hypothetical protein